MNIWIGCILVILGIVGGGILLACFINWRLGPPE